MGRDSRIAMVRLGTDNRDLNKGLRDAEKATQTWGNRVKGHISSSLRGAFGGLGGITGLAGIAGFGAMARDVMKFNAGLVDLQISARKSRGEMLQFNAALQATAAATGAQQEEILAGAQKYTELTGKFDEFAASMDTFAKAQVATGATMESLVGAAAALSSNLDVKPDAMLAALDAITAQGKNGKIEIKDLAAELPGLTGQFSQFGTTGLKGTIELGAAMQIMAKGFGSASETATGMQSLMTAFVKNATKLKGIGVNVFDKDGKARDFMTIMFELIEKSKGDPRVLQRILGRQEAVQAIIPVIQAGKAAYQDLVNVGAKGGEIMSDFAERSTQGPAQMAKAMAHFKAVFNDALMKNMNAIVSAFESLVKALSWMAQHPEALAGLAVLWKSGGFLSTLGGLGAAGGAGGLGALGAGAGSTAGGAGRGARVLGAVGGAMQGAAVGYAVATALDQSGMERAAITVTAALGGLPGPIGAVASSLTILTEGLVAVFNYLSGEIDKKNAAIAAQTYGAESTQQNEDILLGKDKSKYVRNPLTGEMFDPITGKKFSEGKSSDYDKRRAALDQMREIFNSGAGTTLDGGMLSYNPRLAEEAIRKNHPELNDAGVRRRMDALRVGRDLLNGSGGADLGQNANAREGFLSSIGQGPMQLVDVAAMNAAGGGAPLAPAAPGKSLVDVLLRVVPIEGYKVTAERESRRKGSR